jgi:hypothetical protein
MRLVQIPCFGIVQSKGIEMLLKIGLLTDGEIGTVF